METFINDSIQKKKHVYFISPSYGDVACFAGDVFGAVVGKIAVTVVNVFTNPGDGKNTHSAKQYLTSFKSPNAKRLYEILDAADASALKPFPIERVTLGMVDALWRKKSHVNLLRKTISTYFSEAVSMYPFFIPNVLSGKLAKEDNETEKELIKKLQKLIPDPKKSVIFCPIGFGKHVDYLLVRNACEKAFGDNVVYIADNSDKLQFANRDAFVKSHELLPVTFEGTQIDTKKKLITSYKHLESKKYAFLTPETYYVRAIVKSKESDLSVKIYKNNLSKEFITEWEMLWKKSPYRHFFNAPSWTIASKQAFEESNLQVLTVYRKDQLVAVLPLVTVKKYGIRVHKTPGDKYFDRSPLLLGTLDGEVITTLMRSLKQIGTFYLPEIDGLLLKGILPYVSSVRVANTSVSRYLLLDEDPSRFVQWKHKKVFLSKLKEEKDAFELKVLTTAIEKHLQTVRAIERASTKSVDFKETFADERLMKLYHHLLEQDKQALWIVMLYYASEPISYIYGFVKGNVYNCTGTSYKLAYRRFSPGLLLNYMMLQPLKEKGIKVLDFSRGESRYKRMFTPYSYRQYAISYGKTPFEQYWLHGWDSIRVWLENNPVWYDRVRIIKNKLIN